MLEKTVVVDSIEVLEDGTMQIRQSTKVFEDGKQLGETYHRWCKSPEDDVSEECDKVKAIANVVWTDEVIKDYKDKQKEPKITE